MNFKRYPALAVFFMFLLFTVSCREKGSDLSSPGQDSGLGKECRTAISLAEEFLSTLDVAPDEYKLISAENLVIVDEEFAGPHLWRLTFKLEELIPEDAIGIIGAGGEIYLEVNVNKGEVDLTGYGE